jgi:hypothetical protein
VVAGIVIVFLSIFTFIYCTRRRSKISDFAIEEDELDSHKYDNNVVSQLHHEEKSDNKIFNINEKVEERFD